MIITTTTYLAFLLFFYKTGRITKACLPLHLFLSSTFHWLLSLHQHLIAIGTSLVAQDGKSVCLQCEDPEVQSWVGKMSWRGKDNPLQYCCLDNPMDRKAWKATVHGI